MQEALSDLNKRVTEAVARYWLTRKKQADRQSQSGRTDQGMRSSVTGGAQMNGFIDLFTDLIVRAVSAKISSFTPDS